MLKNQRENKKGLCLDQNQICTKENCPEQKTWIQLTIRSQKWCNLRTYSQITPMYFLYKSELQKSTSMLLSEGRQQMQAHFTTPAAMRGIRRKVGCIILHLSTPVKKRATKASIFSAWSFPQPVADCQNSRYSSEQPHTYTNCWYLQQKKKQACLHTTHSDAQTLSFSHTV